MATVGITGGTGFLGGHITGLLNSKGYEVIVFTRNPEKYETTGNVSYALWDPAKQKADIQAFEKLDAVVHLAGEGLAEKRWTNKRKKEIKDSRTQGTAFLVNQLKQHSPNCKTLISASAIGYYGPDRGGGSFKETDSPYNDFLAETCVLWEKASEPAGEIMRRLIFRFGVILGNDGGAFPKFVQPVKYGIKPMLGGGRQIISWIHVDDLAHMILYAIENEKLTGVYNAVAPAPVQQKLLMNTIGYKVKGISLPIPVPSIFLKIGLGEMSIEVLKSATVSADKILAAGFHFQYPTIADAVGQLIGKDA